MPSPSVAKAGLPKTEELRRKLEQLKARRERIDARLHYLASKQARRADTRRKILVGAIILAQLERGEIDQRNFRAMLDKTLTRADDRALFGFDAR
ncbi:MAG TPA: mobilization protein [Steroidobacteraceae bacterium]